MPVTPNRQLPYPSADLPADVPLDMQKLAEKVDLELVAFDSRQARSVRRVITGTHTFNATTWTSLQVASDLAALTLSFTKKRADTRLLLTLNMTAQPEGSENFSRWGAGLRVASVDYEIARVSVDFVRTRGARQYFTGTIEVTGLAAGVYSIQPRLIRLFSVDSGATLKLYADDDIISYTVQETA